MVTARRVVLLRLLFMSLLGVVVAIFLVSCGSQSSTPSASAGLEIVEDTALPGNTSRFDYEAFDPDSGRLFIAHLGASEVVVFETRTNQSVTIKNITEVHGLLVVPQLGKVYASATGSGSVSVIDTKTLAVIATVDAGQYPDGLAYDPDVDKIYISDETGRTESVIDAQTNRLLKKIPLGGEVGNTQYDSSSHRILVPVQTRNQLAKT